MRLLIILVCLLPNLLFAEAYRYVDPKTGEVVFTDKPPGNQAADKITIQTPSVATPYQAPAPETVAADQNDSQDNAPAVSLRILTPQAEETIRNTGGKLEVTTALSNAGKLKEFIIRYRLDGEIVSESPALATTLDNVYRGTHSITAELVSLNGQVITTAEPHTFYVHQNVRAQPKPPTTPPPPPTAPVN